MNEVNGNLKVRFEQDEQVKLDEFAVDSDFVDGLFDFNVSI